MTTPLEIKTGGTVRYNNKVKLYLKPISYLIQPLTLERGTKAHLSQSEQNCSTKTLKLPNLIHSTCVYACFEAQDTIANFHIALDRYKG